MEPRIKTITSERCPSCLSNNFSVKLAVSSVEKYDVENAEVKQLGVSEMQCLAIYQFKCKKCGDEWESDTFTTDIEISE